MSSLEQMVDRHIREHEARLKHIDELMERADTIGISDTELKDEFHKLREKRDKLAEELELLKTNTES